MLQCIVPWTRVRALGKHAVSLRLRIRPALPAVLNSANWHVLCIRHIISFSQGLDGCLSHGQRHGYTRRIPQCRLSAIAAVANDNRPRCQRKHLTFEPHGRISLFGEEPWPAPSLGILDGCSTDVGSSCVSSGLVVYRQRPKATFLVDKS